MLRAKSFFIVYDLDPWFRIFLRIQKCCGSNYLYWIKIHLDINIYISFGRYFNYFSLFIDSKQR